MFDVGDYIVYGQNGICQVVDITHPDISGADNSRLYYVLVPEKTRESRLFCPADNDKIVLRKVVTADEARSILDDAKELEPMSIANDRLRDDSYRQVLRNGDLRLWVQFIKALMLRKREREDSGKKITATDERYLKIAEEGLCSELAIATGENKDEIKKYIIDVCA